MYNNTHTQLLKRTVRIPAKSCNSLYYTNRDITAVEPKEEAAEFVSFATYVHAQSV